MYYSRLCSLHGIWLLLKSIKSLYGSLHLMPCLCQFWECTEGVWCQILVTVVAAQFLLLFVVVKSGDSICMMTLRGRC